MHMIANSYRDLNQLVQRRADGVIAPLSVIISLMVAAAIAVAVMHLQLPQGAAFN